MTIYLRDDSRPTSARDVTCNLFWKDEEACPPWEKANWKVICLWNVVKRASGQFDTQLIGQSGGFGWALWAPGFYGSNEMLEVCHADRKLVPSCYLNPEGFRTLKAQASTFHDTLTPPQLSGSATPFASEALEASIPQKVSELKVRGNRKVSLCVEVTVFHFTSPFHSRY